MEKLLAIVSIGQRAYGRWLFQRLLPTIIMVVGLTIVISIMVSAMMVGGFYSAYLALLNYGTEPPVAMMIVATASILTIAMFVGGAFLALRHLRQKPKEIITQSPLTYGVLVAFASGFLAD